MSARMSDLCTGRRVMLNRTETEDEYGGSLRPEEDNIDLHLASSIEPANWLPISCNNTSVLQLVSRTW